MAKETYYWVGPGNYGGGKKAITKGEEMPKDADIEFLLAKGKISTSRTTTERELSELDSLREEVKTLKNEGGEVEKLKADLKLAQEGGAQADCEECPKLEAQIKELEESQDVDSKANLDLIAETFKNTQQGDSKDEIWKKVKEIKDLLKGE